MENTDEEFFRQLRQQINIFVQHPGTQVMLYQQMPIELYRRQVNAQRQGRAITLQEAMNSYNRDFDMQEANPRQ